MNDLRTAAQDYLTMRRALGFKLETQGRLLLHFVDYLQLCGESSITIENATAWATLPSRAQPVWWTRRLSVVRCFATYLQAFDPATEVPPARLLPKDNQGCPPYLYSGADIAALMQAAAAFGSPLRALTCQTIIGLLAVTGLRIGEAIRLDDDDFDADRALLRVIGTKFGKSRLVPLAPSTVTALADYQQRRDRLHPRPHGPALFISTVGTRLFHPSVEVAFACIRDRAGLQPGPGRRPPRLHDLRHSFAVATLLDWYRTGADVPARLPSLSTYLGHGDPVSTFWYLHASPELLALAADRLEQARRPR